MSRKKIKAYLEEKEVYHEAYDFQISLLMDQIALYNQARKTIKEEGLSVPGSNARVNEETGEPIEKVFMVRNQHLKTLQECIQNIGQLTTKLGLSVKDYRIIKELMGDPKNPDGFEEEFE